MFHLPSQGRLQDRWRGRKSQISTAGLPAPHQVLARHTTPHLTSVTPQTCPILISTSPYIRNFLCIPLLSSHPQDTLSDKSSMVTAFPVHHWVPDSLYTVGIRKLCYAAQMPLPMPGCAPELQSLQRVKRRQIRGLSILLLTCSNVHGTSDDRGPGLHTQITVKTSQKKNWRKQARRSLPQPPDSLSLK